MENKKIRFRMGVSKGAHPLLSVTDHTFQFESKLPIKWVSKPKLHCKMSDQFESKLHYKMSERTEITR